MQTNNEFCLEFGDIKSIFFRFRVLRSKFIFYARSPLNQIQRMYFTFSAQSAALLLNNQAFTVTLTLESP